MEEAAVAKAKNLLYSGFNKKELEEFIDFLRQRDAEEVLITRRKLRVSFGRKEEEDAAR